VVWDEVSMQQLQKLIASMLNQIQEMILARGGSTRSIVGSVWKTLSFEFFHYL